MSDDAAAREAAELVKQPACHHSSSRVCWKCAASAVAAKLRERDARIQGLRRDVLLQQQALDGKGERITALEAERDRLAARIGTEEQHQAEIGQFRRKRDALRKFAEKVPHLYLDGHGCSVACAGHMGLDDGIKECARLGGQCAKPK